MGCREDMNRHCSGDVNRAVLWDTGNIHITSEHALQQNYHDGGSGSALSTPVSTSNFRCDRGKRGAGGIGFHKPYYR